MQDSTGSTKTIRKAIVNKKHSDTNIIDFAKQLNLSHSEVLKILSNSGITITNDIITNDQKIQLMTKLKSGHRKTVRLDKKKSTVIEPRPKPIIQLHQAKKISLPPKPETKKLIEKSKTTITLEKTTIKKIIGKEKPSHQTQTNIQPVTTVEKSQENDVILYNYN